MQRTDARIGISHDGGGDATNSWKMQENAFYGRKIMMMLQLHDDYEYDDDHKDGNDQPLRQI